MVKSSGSTRLVVLSLRCCLPYYEYYESFSPHPRSFQVSHQPTSPPASLSPFPIYSLLQYPGSLAFGAWARPALTSTTSGQNKTQASTPRCISTTLSLGLCSRGFYQASTKSSLSIVILQLFMQHIKKHNSSGKIPFHTLFKAFFFAADHDCTGNGYLRLASG